MALTSLGLYATLLFVRIRITRWILPIAFVALDVPGDGRDERCEASLRLAAGRRRGVVGAVVGCTIIRRDS
jgi:hypothetical protein